MRALGASLGPAGQPAEPRTVWALSCERRRGIESAAVWAVAACWALVLVAVVAAARSVFVAIREGK